MNRFVAAGALAGFCLIFAGTGCEIVRKDISQEDLILQTLGNWQNGIETKNLDKIMANYSDSFVGEDGMNKAGLRQFIENAIQQGFLEGAKVDLKTANIEIQKDAAQVTPILLTSEMGSRTVTLHLKKERDRVWRIVAAEMAE